MFFIIFEEKAILVTKFNSKKMFEVHIYRENRRHTIIRVANENASQFPETWHDAKKLCEQNKGWRLPTLEELACIWKDMQDSDEYEPEWDKFPLESKYWSSTSDEENMAYYFETEEEDCSCSLFRQDLKNNFKMVRAVKTVNS
jgi:hypothetical protein